MPQDSPGIQFAKLVRRMRDAQNRYFKIQTVSNLERAKALERQVDKFIESLNIPKDGQMQNQEMFPGH